MDAVEVKEAVTIDAVWLAEIQAQWLALMGLCVFGDIKSSRLGAMTKMRKRLLEVGERLRSLGADRAWIPQPREQVKNALGSSFNLKDSLLQFERSAADVDGGTEKPAFDAATVRLHTVLLERLQVLENRWAQLLDSPYEDDGEDAHAQGSNGIP